MNVDIFMEIATQGVVVLVKLAAPLMLVSLVVGLIVSLFQALTQIQEMTLAFVPKILVIFMMLIVFLPFMLSTLITYTESLYDRIITLG